MNTIDNTSALFGAINDNAESTGKAHGARRCAIIAESGDNIAVAVILAPSTCKMETRGRIRVALRALPQFPAKDAQWTMGNVAKWESLPDAVRAPYAEKIPAHDDADTVYLVTATRKPVAVNA